MDRNEYRALTPWSFFLPIALAVTFGVLVANALGATLFGGSGSGDVTQGAEAAALPDPPPEAADAKQTVSKADATPATAGSEGTAATAAEELPVLEPVRLPGPSSARRDGETRACIGGTIAVRAANGWEQEVVNDAPARCVAGSN